MKEVIDRDELVEGTGIQTAADLNIISSQQSHSRSVLLLKHLPLKGRAEQQEVVVCTEPGRGGQNLVQGDKAGHSSRLCVLTEYEGRIGSLGKVRQVKPLNHIGGHWLSCHSPGVICPHHTK